MPAPETAPIVPDALTERPIDKVNPNIVVLGGGFAGLNFAKSLGHTNARITLIDRQNHHLFQPLLYQVATAGLSSDEIAKPLRGILAGFPNISVELGEVETIDLVNRTVVLANRRIHYDYVILALGGVTSYFGHSDWAEHAPGLKSISDALRIRREILLSFEKAETSQDPEEVERLMTVAIVGGGPTGVELAGAVKELGRFVMRRDFRRIDPTKVRVILIEGLDRLLPPFPRDLSESAKQQLEDIGVEIRLNTMVKDIQPQTVVLATKEKPDSLETIRASTIIWAAGVGANPLTRTLGVKVDRAGRIEVDEDCSIPGHPEAFAVGDIAFIKQANGSPVPGVSPAAIQMGQYVAKVIQTELADPHLRPDQRDPFAYWDKGSMATIGHSRAVAWIGSLKFSGFLAWLAWLLVHLMFLVGFTNKVTVVVRWLYAFFTRRQDARVISSEEYHLATPSTGGAPTSLVTPPKPA